MQTWFPWVVGFVGWVVVMGYGGCSAVAPQQESVVSDGSVHTESSVWEQPNDVAIQEQGNTFSCGNQNCQVGQQYCKPYAPGACVGNPIPPEGCPKFCQPMQCGGPQGVCYCTTYSCVAFPAGCSDCACLKAQTGSGSSCICETKDGGLWLNCPSP